MEKILIDFDNTIHDAFDGWNEGKPYGEPIKDAIKVINKLAEKYEIWIFTVGGSWEYRKKLLGEWLDKYHINYTGITDKKEPAEAIIDDKAIKFIDWDNILKKLNMNNQNNKNNNHNIVKQYQDKKVSDYLEEKPQRVGLFFWHGAGDLLEFLEPLQELKKLYPDTRIDLILQKGVGQEAICPDVIFVSNEEELQELNYNYIFHIHFPMSEGDKEVTPKSEKCCIEELGIEPISKHPKLDLPKSKLIGVSFQATALPGNVSVDEKTAEKIWNEILESDHIPIEIMMEHMYHNPVNKKYDFINRSIRDIKPNLKTMMSVIGRCKAFLGVSSGPIHLALSLLPDEKVAFLEKDFLLRSITRKNIKTFKIKKYQDGEVKQWLDTL